MKKVKDYLPTKDQLRKEDLAEVDSVSKEIDKHFPNNGMQKVMEHLFKLATSPLYDESANIKAIELILAYKYGKPTDSKLSSDIPTKLVIEHNTITVDEVKRLKGK